MSKRRISAIIHAVFASVILVLGLLTYLSFQYMPHSYLFSTFVKFSPDANWLLIGSQTGDAQIWNLADNSPSGRLLAIRRSYLVLGDQVQFYDDHTLVVLGKDDSGNTYVVFWDFLLDREVERFPIEHSLHTTLFVSDCRNRLATVDFVKHSEYIISVWDLKTRSKLSVSRVRSQPREPQLSETGDVLAYFSWEEDNSIVVSDALSFGELYRGPHEGIDHFLLSPSGKRLLLISETGSTEVALDTGAVSPSRPTVAPGAQFSSDESTILDHDGIDTWRVWDAKNGKRIAEIPGRSSWKAAVVSPKGKWIAFDPVRKATLWNIHSGECKTLPSISEGPFPHPIFMFGGLCLVLPFWGLAAICTLLLRGPKPPRGDHQMTDVVTAQLA